MLGHLVLRFAVALGVAASAAPAPRSDAGVGGQPQAARPSGIAIEVVPRPARGALEEGMSGEPARFYAASISAIRAGQYRRALTEIRQARVLYFRALQHGPLPAAGDLDAEPSGQRQLGQGTTPRRLLARHFTRARYLEEQLAELVAIDEQLEHMSERGDPRSAAIQVRPMLLHNLFLAVRGFLGVSDNRLLREGLRAYEVALEEADRLKHPLRVGYAALLAERGSRREARQNFDKLSEQEREQENLDIAVSYYYLALGDRGRAITRLLQASTRDSWLHGAAGVDGQPFRSQVYRMNDFDRLRDHPRFIELVTDPEEK
jgi:predicted Zn-dependent protease